MPTIDERKGRFRRGQFQKMAWRVQVRIKEGSRTKEFPFSKETRADVKNVAYQWGLNEEVKLRSRHVPTLRYRELEEWTLGKLIDKYINDWLPKKKSPENEAIMLSAFMRRESALCNMKLSTLRQSDFGAARDRMSKKGDKGSTVRRLFTPLKHMFKIAKKEWDIPIDENPLTGIWLPKPPIHRTRVLLKDTNEKERLYAAMLDCRSNANCLLWCTMVETAITLGLRRGEIITAEPKFPGLQWRDIQFEERRLFIKDSKTGKERLLPLPNDLRSKLWCFRSLIKEEYRRPNEFVFPVHPSTFNMMWTRIKRRAGIEDFHFHDLRHVASTEWSKKPISLTMPQNDYMRNGNNGSYTYTHADIEEILEQLNKGQEHIELNYWLQLYNAAAPDLKRKAMLQTITNVVQFPEMKKGA